MLPTLSLTISCQTKIKIGYAFASPLISKPITVSESDIKRESCISANLGLSIDGIPSFGGPPPFILSSGIRCFTPSVSIIVSSDETSDSLVKVVRGTDSPS